MKKLVYYNPNYKKEKTAKAYNINNFKKWKIKALFAITDIDTFSSYEDITEFYNILKINLMWKITWFHKLWTFRCSCCRFRIWWYCYTYVQFFKKLNEFV